MARNIALEKMRAMSTPTEYVIIIDMDVMTWDPNGW